MSSAKLRQFFLDLNVLNAAHPNMFVHTFYDLLHFAMVIWRLGLSHQASSRWRHVIMGTMASQITSLTIVYSTVYSDQSKHQSSASLAFVWGIHPGPVNSPHKWPVTRKMFPFDEFWQIWVHGSHTFTNPFRISNIELCFCYCYKHKRASEFVSERIEWVSEWVGG